jgi:hypothetical protein
LGRQPHPAARRLGAAVAGVLAVAVAGCALLQPPVAPRASRESRTPEPVIVPSDPPDEAPTIRPESSGGIPDLQDAADGLADLESYRVAVRSTGLVPSSAADGSVSMTSTLLQGDHPAAEFTMVGVDGLEGGRLQAVVIGDEAWLKAGTGPWTKTPGGAADFDAAFTALSPIELAGGFEALGAVLVPVRREKKNGAAAIHYRADSVDPAIAAAGLTSGTADLWTAAAGGYLVALDVAGTWDVDGTATPVTLQIDVTRVNDPANRVHRPA